MNPRQTRINLFIPGGKNNVLLVIDGPTLSLETVGPDGELLADDPVALTHHDYGKRIMDVINRADQDLRKILFPEGETP